MHCQAQPMVGLKEGYNPCPLYRKSYLCPISDIFFALTSSLVDLLRSKWLKSPQRCLDAIIRPLPFEISGRVRAWSQPLMVNSPRLSDDPFCFNFRVCQKHNMLTRLIFYPHFRPSKYETIKEAWFQSLSYSSPVRDLSPCIGEFLAFHR